MPLAAAAIAARGAPRWGAAFSGRRGRGRGHPSDPWRSGPPVAGWHCSARSERASGPVRDRISESGMLRAGARCESVQFGNDGGQLAGGGRGHLLAVVQALEVVLPRQLAPAQAHLTQPEHPRAAPHAGLRMHGLRARAGAGAGADALDGVARLGHALAEVDEEVVAPPDAPREPVACAAHAPGSEAAGSTRTARRKQHRPQR